MNNINIVTASGTVINYDNVIALKEESAELVALTIREEIVLARYRTTALAKEALSEITAKIRYGAAWIEVSPNINNK